MQNVLPAIPQPPHDPTWWLLNAQTGWRVAKQSERVEITNGQLALEPLPGCGRSLTEASGSLGGLTLPANVAFGPDGTLYLLDAKTLTLKRFDPCTCQFVTVPCFGGTGHGRRQLSNPHGIVIFNGNLFVCDTDNHRLSVFTLPGFVWRTAWQSPTSAKLTNAWEPYAVAFTSEGRAFVTDGANGCIHRFSPSGRWETCLSGFGKVTFIAIDCQDRLYVVIEGKEDSVQVVNADGQLLETASRPETLAPRFPRLPFQVDAQGNLFLAGLCVDLKPSSNNGRQRPQPQGVFDLYGDAVTKVVDTGGLQYNKEGSYISEGLDSKLYKCQWHRILLRTQVPKGTRLTVSTYTAEVLQPPDFVKQLPEDVWETKQSVLESGDWDCLVRNGGGRYLWLRLQLRGNGLATPAIEHVQVEFPRISLLRYLPPVFAEDPSGTQLTDRFLSIFDTTMRSIETKLDYLAGYFDPLSAAADPKAGRDFLSWLASWIGVQFDRQWPEEKRRQFLQRAARLYHIRGTREGMYRQLLFFLGMEPQTICCADDQPKTRCQLRPANCEPVKPQPCAWQPPPLILEHYQLRRWLFVGSGRLGDQAVLWGKRIVNRSQLDANAQVAQSQLISTQDPYRDPFHVYAHKFSVFVPASYGRSDKQKKALENLINAQKPAHTQVQIEYVEPRFRIGFQSMIGLDTVIGRYPEGVTLDTTPLGSASVLGEPPDKQGKPTLRIGKQSRIGSTTRLD